MRLLLGDLTRVKATLATRMPKIATLALSLNDRVMTLDLLTDSALARNHPHRLPGYHA